MTEGAAENSIVGDGGVKADAATFDDLVTAATVGVSRKPLPDATLSGTGETDQADALLDAAALRTVARRAGYQPPRGVTTPDAPAETTPTFSVRAAGALRKACDWKPGVGLDLDNQLQSGLLTDLLTATARAGYVASPLLLPGLLDAAARRIALRPVVAAVLGARGRWLAGQRTDWRPVAEHAAPAGMQADPGDQKTRNQKTWRTGVSAQRRTYLTRLRQADPDAARDLLADGWATETGADRAEFIAILDDGLSLADADFLEAALDDRASAVRNAARRMLARLPGSAFGQRAAERADAVLGVEQRGRHSVLAAAPPRDAPDATATRDGITGRPPVPSIGAGAWQLTEIVAATPLGHWTARFGMTPYEIASLPVTDDLRPDVHAGWRLAAVSQRNAGWAYALLQADGPGAGGNRPHAAWPPDHELAVLLPPEQRAARAAALLADAPLSAPHPPGWVSEAMPLVREIAGYPSPWPRVLAGAVLTAVARAASAGRMRGAAGMLAAAAGRGLPATGPVDYAAALTRMADEYSHSAPPLRAAAATIAARRVFLTEIGLSGS